MEKTQNILLVLTNVPELACANFIARTLIENRLAACVNILAPCHSVYRWQGKIEQATEIPLLIKTTAQCYAALAASLQHLHPYDVPEIIAWPITQGAPNYLQWVQANVVTSAA